MTAKGVRYAPVTKPVKAGSLPVWLEPAAGKNAGSVPKAVRVQLASHTQALRTGANGMLLGLTSTGGSTRGRVRVVIDYAAVAKAYGGGFGSRLQLVELPACALTTPQDAACQQRTPIRFINRVGANQLTATVTLGTAAATPPQTRAVDGPASMAPHTALSNVAASETTALAITSSTSGSQGDYAATPLNPSATWQTSGTGSFTYAYPIAVPATIGGNAPNVGLNYDSQSEDGETSARNSQASSIGDGWDYQPGFVERSYRPCNSLLDSSGNKILKDSGDECWGGDNATLSFGSHAGTLVPDGIDSSVTGEIQQWRLQGDDGTLVQELSGAANGLYDGTYFRVLTPDGTAAYFGADHAPTGPGTSATMPASPADSSTGSAWGVPVLHPVSSDPCYESTTGKASKCDKPEGWQWNLDFVVSPSGFVQRYDYTPETNYYDLGGGQAATGDSGTLTSYTRGGSLTSIRYGYTVADEQAGRTPAGEVDFAPAQRCQTTSTFTNCSASNLNDSTAVHWPDVPWDLHCDPGDSTQLPDGATSVPANVCVTASPTFWTTTRWASITTQVHVKDSNTDALKPVDFYQLGQVYSDAGGAVDPVTGTTVDQQDAGSLQAVMWLQSIQHTGQDTYGNGDSNVTLNQVTFTGTEIDNRVNDFRPSAPPLYRPRISTIQTETGSSVAVQYNSTPCAGVSLSASMADSNTHACYPVYWTVPGDTKPIADWFNKPTVKTVTVSDLTGASNYKPNSQNIAVGSQRQVTSYSYAGPAWHRDDSAQTDDQYRTWDQFRGFRTVMVQTGEAPDPITQQTTTYLQGMDGDYKADGTRRSVSITAQAGGAIQTVTDADPLYGTALESDTFTKAGGPLDSVSINNPTSYTTTAHAAETPWTDWNTADNPGQTQPALSTLPDLTAYRINSGQEHDYDLLANSTWRHSETDTNYDSRGRVTTVDDHGDVSDASQEKCTTTSYATEPSTNTMMWSYPDQTTTVHGPCGTTPSASTLIADKKIYYNGDGTLTNLGTLGTLSATGRVTGTSVATGYTGTTENWRTTAATKYDGAGRATDTYDATGQKTHTDYSPAWSSGGNNTDVRSYTTTNSQGWQVSSTLDALHGLPLEDVDANGRKTDMTYDALGRRTAVWLPGRDKAGGQSADETFAYSVNPGAVPAPDGIITPGSGGAPTSVTTNTLLEDNTYATSIAIYDGMLQPRQTQSSPMGDSRDGRIISDTFYDSHGWPVYNYAPYPEINSGTPPSASLFAANEDTIQSESTTTYDGEGRATASTLFHQAVPQWTTATSYPGADETDTTAPAGGRSTATFSNALGETTSTVVKNTGTTVTLPGGTVIPSGTSLTSDSVRLTMQADGNLVLSALSTGTTVWSSGTSNNPGAYAKFGTDGNLVVDTTSGTQLWATGLAATTGSTLQVRNDSTLAVVGSNGSAVLWQHGTSGAVPEADATTRYTYTPAGQVATVKDSAGNTWSYAYDLLGEPLSQTDPNTGTATFDKYDVAGNLLQTTDPRGQVLSYSYDWDNRPTAEYSAAWSATPDTTKEQASWAYDTLEKGYPTSATRYVNGATGTASKAYIQAVTSYNTAYQPLGQSLTVPAADGFAAAGQSAPPGSGSVTYTTNSTYTDNLGFLNSSVYQADGGLPAETVTYGYNTQGDLTGFAGFISPTNLPAYADNIQHDPLGRVVQANYGPSGKELATTAQYDTTTGQVTQTSDQIQGQATPLDVVSYRYNQVGETTAIDDLQNNTTHDTQCFAYDSFQRLTEAWTDTKGITNPGDASGGTPGDTGGCTTGRVQTTTAAPIATTSVGGPAPYWQTYTYDLLGDRTGMVNHDTGGNALNNTTQSIAFTGANGATPAALPDQAGTTTSSNPTSGTATWTPTYTDPAYGNKNAGNTMSRKVTTTGPISSTFTLSGGGKRCVDDAGGLTTPGNKVQVNTCSGTSAQNWTIGTDGTVRVLGMCLDTVGNATTSGTLAVIDTCNSDPTQKWVTTTAGKLASKANNSVCLTDPGASATTGTQLTIATCPASGQTWATAATGALPPGQTQSLTYDTEGRTATATNPSGTHNDTSKYLYDADGNLLEQTSAVDGADKTRILYLFGGAEQITLNVTAGTFTALRDYTGPDGTTVTRSSTGTVTYQVSNAQGTATTAIDAGTLAVTRRSYDPWGNPRGTTPTSWVAPDENHGFLGQPTDTTTGLDLLGARNYDPTQGRFLTPDPIFEAGDPNQMGGYTYAGDNPATASDPTGLARQGGDGTGDGPVKPPKKKKHKNGGGGGGAEGGGQSSGGGSGLEQVECACATTGEAGVGGEGAGEMGSDTLSGGGNRGAGEDDPGEGAEAGKILPPSGDPVDPPAGDDWEHPGAPGSSEVENGAVGKGLSADSSEPEAGKASTSNTTKATSQGDSGASEDATSQDAVNKSAAKPSDLGKGSPSTGSGGESRGGDPEVAVQQDAAANGDDLARVGRWMSRDEHDAMAQSGVVQEGAGGTTYVANPADPAAYGRQAAPGTGYVEFDVPHSSLYPAGEPGWAQIPGPNSLQARLALRRGLPPPQFPPALNIQWLMEK